MEILACYGKVADGGTKLGYGVDCHVSAALSRWFLFNSVSNHEHLIKFSLGSFPHRHLPHLHHDLTAVISQVKNDDGLSPCDLIESSYASFQAILTSTRFNMELFDMLLLDRTTSEEV